MKRLLVGLLGIMIMQTKIVLATNNGWELAKNKALANSDFVEKSVDSFNDDVLPSDDINSVILSDIDKRSQKIWGISEPDMKRYKLLMQSKSGVYYKDKELSPIEILGINARDNTERDHFAKLLVKANSQRIAKELAFEKSYSRAYKKHIKNNNLPVVRNFDTDKYSPFNYKAVDLQDGDDLMLFVNNEIHVRRIIGPLLSEIINNNKVKLNVYFMDKKIHKDEIFSWAKKQNIPVDLVKDKRITLNIGYNGFNKINKNETLPAMYLVRSGDTTEIDLSRF